MKILIKGESVLNNEEIRSAVKFYLSNLLPPEKIRNLEINIILKHILGPKGGISTGHKGECSYYLTKSTPRNFIVTINNYYGRATQLKSLAHEIVHVKQYVQGELIDHKEADLHHWQGKLHKANVNKDEDYWVAPWEIDAHGREIGLYRLYLKNIKN